MRDIMLLYVLHTIALPVQTHWYLEICTIQVFKSHSFPCNVMYVLHQPEMSY